MNVDYRVLLKKYIDHVGQEEGTAFLDDEWLNTLPVDEAAALREIDAESLAEMAERRSRPEGE